MKQGDADRIRGLFERATSLQLPPKKMKFLFKRWLDYEASLGDQGAPFMLRLVLFRAVGLKVVPCSFS